MDPSFFFTTVRAAHVLGGDDAFTGPVKAASRGLSSNWCQLWRLGMAAANGSFWRR